MLCIVSFSFRYSTEQFPELRSSKRSTLEMNSPLLSSLCLPVVSFTVCAKFHDQDKLGFLAKLINLGYEKFSILLYFGYTNLVGNFEISESDFLHKVEPLFE